MIQDQQHIDQMIDKSKKEGFEKFMRDPLVRITLSRIPSGEDADGLKLLLQSAYDQGHTAGQGVVLMSLIEGMTLRPRGATR